MGNSNCIKCMKEFLFSNRRNDGNQRSEFTTLPRLNLNKKNQFSSRYLQPRSQKYYKLEGKQPCNFCGELRETYKIFDEKFHEKLGGKNPHYNVCYSCANNLEHEIYI